MSQGPITFPPGVTEIGVQNVILAGIISFSGAAEYQKFTGKKAPYDKTKALKYWIDTDKSRYDNGQLSPFRGHIYKIIVRDTVVFNGTPVHGDPVIEDAYITFDLAPCVNIPPDNVEGAGDPRGIEAQWQFPIDESITEAQLLADPSPFGIRVTATSAL
jgi:hypothetical protein